MRGLGLPRMEGELLIGIWSFVKIYIFYKLIFFQVLLLFVVVVVVVVVQTSFCFLVQMHCYKLSDEENAPPVGN